LVRDPKFIGYRDDLTRCIHGDAPVHGDHT
jgi:hypothetical protein